jgi:hypothetical protein
VAGSGWLLIARYSASIVAYLCGHGLMVHEAKPFGIPERLYALDACAHRCIGGSVLALQHFFFRAHCLALAA